MNILVTGGAGYLGSVLIPKLLVRGHRVRVLDIGYFGVGHLRSLRPAIDLVRDDIRRASSDKAFCRELLEGCQCIIHLAAISNDPSADLNPELTDEVNFQATVALAEVARELGVRMIFSSSCSVYGEAEVDMYEESAVNPLTTYAISKVMAEQALTVLGTSSWSPVILRNGTLFGYSPRMRFDLVANIFSLYSVLYGEIKIFGDGQQWRPFLHVSDCARAMLYFAEHTELPYSCYNIAQENLRVVDLAAIFCQINPHLKVTHLEITDPDHRDYRVSTRRMEEVGFKTRTNIEGGAEEMVEALITGLIPDPESIYYRNAKWLKELTQLGSREHGEIINLMETLVHMHPPIRL